VVVKIFGEKKLYPN